MTDEIRKVISKEVDAMDRRFESGSNVADSIIEALAEYGYEIVPEWSDKMDAAPRDGTPVLFYAPEYTPPFMVVNCFGETEEHFSASINAETVYGATHWKPITTLNEANADG